MKHKITIGVVLLSILLLFAGTVMGTEKGPSAIDEKIAMEKIYVEMKCDPCDYNIDYGDTMYPGEKGGVDEGMAKLDCDPCDYNIDYGGIYHHPIEKRFQVHDSF